MGAIMFKKILVANRGEIAVRILNACREMGIATIAVYESAEQNALHVRLADYSLLLETGFRDRAALLSIAQEQGADAIHPGYGFLAEDPDFVRACTAAGIAFIGPSAQVMETVHDKLGTLQTARANGFRTVETSEVCFDETGMEAVHAEAQRLGYPVVIKSGSGGRGPGEYLVRSPELLSAAVRNSLAEGQTVYGQRSIYLEKAILPVHQIGIQILADQHGHIVHLGDREGLLQPNSRKIIEESPAPCLTPAQRQHINETALSLAQLFHYDHLGTVEFLVDADGQFYFTEIKGRLQAEHALTELCARIDLVREQIRAAAGETLSLSQDDVHLDGVAMLCRINAEDPLNRLMPSPGRVEKLRLPAGMGVRVDTYLEAGAQVPEAYGSLIAKLAVWGSTRDAALARLLRALEDFVIAGIPTNIPHIQRIAQSESFAQAAYAGVILPGNGVHAGPDERYHRDAAVAAAVLFALRQRMVNPTQPERVQTGWHRSSRRLAD
jgi:acetyl/propionyl-CoA carboxylase alpha subunit